MSDAFLQLDAARKHFDEQTDLYGDTTIVSLVNHKGHEKPVKEAFEQRLSEVGSRSFLLRSVFNIKMLVIYLVTPYNIAYLQELVRNGPREYPGARFVIRDTGERIDLKYNKSADAFLRYGWIVERHLKDGE